MQQVALGFSWFSMLIMIFLATNDGRVTSISSSLRVLEESCLVPFLQQLLENDSLLDVDRHASLYTAVFKVHSYMYTSIRTYMRSIVGCSGSVCCFVWCVWCLHYVCIYDQRDLTRARSKIEGKGRGIQTGKPLMPMRFSVGRHHGYSHTKQTSSIPNC